MSSSIAPAAKKKSDLPHAVIRFLRPVSFPRFSMSEGERWGFVATQKNAERLRQIKSGGRFDFAGGQCLACDVELVYEGPGNLEYSIAMGTVTNQEVINKYRLDRAKFEALAIKLGGE